ncbi:MAG: outer membrane protein [Candidatus Berkiella sp.]
MFNNKHGKPIYLHALQLLLLLFCFSSTASFAVCGMDDEDDYYGSAETCPFKNAVEGTEALNPSDVAFLNAVNATRIINRWYMRLMVGKPKIKLDDIENDSVGTFNGLPPFTPAFNQNLLQVTLAGGYFWEQWAAEFEILFSKRFDFTFAPVFLSAALPVPQAQVQLNQVAAFINLQYVVPRLFSWYPRRLQIHFDAGVGPSLKMANVSTFTLAGAPLQSGSKRTLTAGANLGLGARYQVTANILVDVAYRYFFLGKAQFGPALAANAAQDVQFTAKTVQSNGFFAGALYQF